ncbi:hypothetical protein MSG28_011407 [Choristoneura fumiferana]|uniref:Uncharacterized protein n=1 Tax=Choristoneura fumiferana TaxID=7141 RepID=A0ACC0JN55_CHOFU|nr:hypothetical protein MSG28_011407 [Choristoneura fumiferana]
MDVTGAKRKGIMHKRRIHRLGGTLGNVQEVREVAKVTEAAADAVAGTVLVKHEHLAGEPIQLHHLGRLGLLVLVRAEGERVLAHLDEHHVAPLPFPPHVLANNVEIKITYQQSIEQQLVFKLLHPKDLLEHVVQLFLAEYALGI